MNPPTAITDGQNRATDFAEHAIAGAERARNGAGQEVNRLIADVEDLVKKVAHVTDADVARVRQKVEQTLAVTRDAVRTGAVRASANARAAAEATDKYVHERPWTAMGIAAAVGVALAVLSSRR